LTFNPDKQGVSAPPAAVPLDESAATRTMVKGKSRQGRQFIAAHVVPEAAKQFKLLAVQQGRTTQALLVEAINDLFAKYGLSRIADE
jgi:hypothetical protein